MSLTVEEDIREFLVNNALVEGATGWKCTIGFLPTDYDKRIVVYLAAGDVPEGRFSQRYFNVQIRGRGAFKGYAELKAKMEAIFQALHTADIDSPSSSPTGLYVQCHAIQSAPLSIGEDESKRPHMTQNYRVISNS